MTKPSQTLHDAFLHISMMSGAVYGTTEFEHWDSIIRKAHQQIHDDLIGLLPKVSYKHLRYCLIRFEEACTCGMSRRNEIIDQITEAISEYCGVKK